MIKSILIKEAQEVVSVIEQYTEASGSRINHEKSEVFWMDEEGEGFELPDAFPEPQQEIKVLGITFGPGDYGLSNWESRLVGANAKVASWKRWKLSVWDPGGLGSATDSKDFAVVFDVEPPETGTELLEHGRLQTA